MANYVWAVEDSTASITFNCRWRSKPTMSNAARIEAAIQDDPANVMVKKWFAALIANTRSIMVRYGDETPTPAFEDMQKYLEWCNANLFTVDDEGAWNGVVADPEVLRKAWDKFQDLVAEPIQEAWAHGYTKAQQILPGKREFLPDSMLTQEELTDPDFLAKRGKR